MVPIHGLWTPHNVTLVLGLAAKHRPLPALLDYAVTVNPQRRAMLGAAARRISRWFRARSFLSKCDAIFDAFEKCVSSWGSISALPSRELCEQRHLVVFKRRDRHRTLPAQTAAADRMEKLARLYFSSLAIDSPIRPRLWPLLTGPTGAGKNHLARLVAGRLRARYLRLSYGDWIVQGSRQISTLYNIINAALGVGRVVLHLDELDKLPFEAPQEWSRAVTNEVWAVLDGELPLERFLNDPDLKSVVDDGARAELARPDFFSRVFIIGSGTWQSVHDHANRPARIVGFGAQVAPASARREVLDALGETRGIASELLARFDGEILFLSPPTVSEALTILE
jgi:hypothetical protein